MEMKGISDLLEGYREKFKSAEKKKQEVIDGIYRSSGIRVGESQIAIKRGILTVSAGSALRNEIFLKKKLILEEFKSIEGIHISDIS